MPHFLIQTLEYERYVNKYKDDYSDSDGEIDDFDEVEDKKLIYRKNDFVKLIEANNETNVETYTQILTKFVEGLNVDIWRLNENDCDVQGGLHFCRMKHVKMWYKYFGLDCNIWRVTLPEDELVLDYGYELKARRIILSDCMPLFNIRKICKIAIKENRLMLKYMKNQHDYMCEMAIRHNCEELRYVKNQTERLCMLAVKKNWMMLQYVKNQTDKICKRALKQSFQALQYVENQTDELIDIAMSQSTDALKYVRNQTESLCRRAISENGFALNHVRNQTPELCELAVQQNSWVLHFIKDQTPELCELAVKKDSYALSYVRDPIIREQLKKQYVKDFSLRIEIMRIEEVLKPGDVGYEKIHSMSRYW